MTAKSYRQAQSQDTPKYLNSEEDVVARRYYVIDADGNRREALISSTVNEVEHVSAEQHKYLEDNGLIKPKTMYVLTE